MTDVSRTRMRRHSHSGRLGRGRGSAGRSRPSLLSPALALVIAIGLPTSAAAFTDPAAEFGGAANRAGATREFTINLYEDGDFASQRTIYWCVAASMQMMLNIVDLTDDDSRAGQERYMQLARGAGSTGWARSLIELGAGGYRQQAVDGYDPAVREAADALRRTGRPVGLIVWRGAHAWVMSGFTATADPLVDPDFRVTAVYIQDPWYPRVSSIWGPGQKPNSLISVNALKADFLPRRGGPWHAELAGKFVLVVPFDPLMPAVRERRMI